MSGPDRRAADIAAALQRCMFGTAERYCGEPAIWHFFSAAGEVALSCYGHRTWWNCRPLTDKHPVGGACGLPDTYWRYSWVDPAGVGYCFVEGLDDSVLAGVELATAGASA